MHNQENLLNQRVYFVFVILPQKWQVFLFHKYLLLSEGTLRTMKSDANLEGEDFSDQNSNPIKKEKNCHGTVGL